MRVLKNIWWIILGLTCLITLTAQERPNTSLVGNQNIQVGIISTGNTIGPIARVYIENISDEPTLIHSGPFIILGTDSTQIYGVYDEIYLSLEPQEDTIIYVDGGCFDPYTLPEPRGDTISIGRVIDLVDASEITAKTEMEGLPGYTPFTRIPDDSLIITFPGTGEIPIPGSVDLANYPEAFGKLAINIATTIEETVDSLFKNGNIPDDMPPNPYSNDPKTLTEGAIGQTVSIAITRLTNPDNPYTRNDLDTILRRQYQDVTGYKLDNAPQDIQDAYNIGKDQIWTLFEYVGKQSKVLNSASEIPIENFPSTYTPYQNNAYKKKVDSLISEIDLEDPQSIGALGRLLEELKHSEADVSDPVREALIQRLQEQLIRWIRIQLDGLIASDGIDIGRWFDLYKLRAWLEGLLPEGFIIELDEGLARIYGEYIESEIRGIDVECEPSIRRILAEEALTGVIDEVIGEDLLEEAKKILGEKLDSCIVELLERIDLTDQGMIELIMAWYNAFVSDIFDGLLTEERIAELREIARQQLFENFSNWVDGYESGNVKDLYENILRDLIILESDCFPFTETMRNELLERLRPMLGEALFEKLEELELSNYDELSDLNKSFIEQYIDEANWFLDDADYARLMETMPDALKTCLEDCLK